jgi:hypothetical protein
MPSLAHSAHFFSLTTVLRFVRSSLLMEEIPDGAGALLLWEISRLISSG